MKVEFVKRKFALFSKPMGSAFLSFEKLSGCITAEGTTDLNYKGSPLHLHVAFALIFSTSSKFEDLWREKWS